MRVSNHMRSHIFGRVLDLGKVDKCKLIIHLVRFRRCGVRERNIMTTVIITKIHHFMRRMGLVRLARMMLDSVRVLRLPYSLVMIAELNHMFHFRFKSKDHSLLFSGFASAVWTNAKMLLNLSVDNWEL